MFLVMGLHWFRQRQEAEADDPRGDCRKQRETQNCQRKPVPEAGLSPLRRPRARGNRSAGPFHGESFNRQDARAPAPETRPLGSRLASKNSAEKPVRMKSQGLAGSA